LLITFVILLATIALLLSNRVPLEVSGFLCLLALIMTGVLSYEEAAAGFSNGVVVTVGALFVLGGALIRTGVAQAAADLLEKWSSGDPLRLMRLVVLTSSALSTVMSSTGTVALLLPTVVNASGKSGKSPSKFLLPLAYGSLFGGMLTLLGGSANLVADETLRNAGRPGFGFFSFTPIGVCILVFGLVYLHFWGYRKLPERAKPVDLDGGPTVIELLGQYGMYDNIYEVQLPPNRDLGCTTLEGFNLRTKYHLEVLALRQAGTGAAIVPKPNSPIENGATLYVQASEEDVKIFCEDFGAGFQKQPAQAPPLEGRSLAELILVPRSKLAGRSLVESQFFRQYGVRVLKVRRADQSLVESLAEARLRVGDTLLVEGSLTRLKTLANEYSDFVVIGLPREISPHDGLTPKGKLCLVITAIMIAAIVGKILAPPVAALAAAVALILTRCISMEESYAAVSWSSLFLVATMLPLGTALTKTGGIEFLTQNLFAAFGSDSSPYLILAAVYFLATILGQVMSNTAAAVLLAPLALDAALTMQVAPEPFLLVLAFGAQMSFLTPIASAGNTLVMVPGSYRFSDFLHLGLPLHLAGTVFSLVLAPWLFPFS